MNTFYQDPSGVKITMYFYNWKVTTDKPYDASNNYFLVCDYQREMTSEFGNLKIRVPLFSGMSNVLNKECREDDINGYVEFVKNYVNQYP